jgi:hypothetical protein
MAQKGVFAGLSLLGQDRSSVRGLLLPKRAATLWEGPTVGGRGTGKAEAARLPDAGTSLKQSRKMSGRRRVAYWTQ